MADQRVPAEHIELASGRGDDLAGQAGDCSCRLVANLRRGSDMALGPPKHNPPLPLKESMDYVQQEAADGGNVGRDA